MKPERECVYLNVGQGSVCFYPTRAPVFQSWSETYDFKNWVCTPESGMQRGRAL